MKTENNFFNKEIKFENSCNKKYKIKVIQFDTRDNKAIELGKEINSTYCKYNGYEYYFEKFNFNIDNYVDIIEFCNNDKDKFLLAVNYHKYELILKFLNNYDYIVFMDSDAVFVNPFKKIEDFIDLEHDIFMSTDMALFSNSFFIYSSFLQLKQYCENNKCNYVENFNEFSKNTVDSSNRSIRVRLGSIWANPSGLNAGFMIIKNSINSFNLINDFKKYCKIFPECIHDQGCLGFLLHSNKFSNLLSILPKYFQGSSIISLEDFKYDEDKNFINHVCGAGDKLLSAFIDVKNNKHWRKILNK